MLLILLYFYVLGKLVGQGGVHTRGHFKVELEQMSSEHLGFGFCPHPSLPPAPHHTLEWPLWPRAAWAFLLTRAVGALLRALASSLRARSYSLFSDSSFTAASQISSLLGLAWGEHRTIRTSSERGGQGRSHVILAAGLGAENRRG